jgi:hypothetical protein
MNWNFENFLRRWIQFDGRHSVVSSGYGYAPAGTGSLRWYGGLGVVRWRFAFGVVEARACEAVVRV